MDSGAWQAAVHGVAKESDTTDSPYTNMGVGDHMICFTFVKGPSGYHMESGVWGRQEWKETS